DLGRDGGLGGGTHKRSSIGHPTRRKGRGRERRRGTGEGEGTQVRHTVARGRGRAYAGESCSLRTCLPASCDRRRTCLSAPPGAAVVVAASPPVPATGVKATRCGGARTRHLPARPARGVRTKGVPVMRRVTLALVASSILLSA